MILQHYLDAPWLIAIVAVVAILGIGRAVRLLTSEDFPPTVALRRAWSRLTKEGRWEKVMYCPWCASPYITALSLGWLALGVLYWEPAAWAWWAIHLWAAIAYLASWVVFHDED